MKRRWSTLDVVFIREHGSLGARKLTRRFGCSETAIRSAASRFGVSLRTPGQRRGALIGLPRGVKLEPGLRVALLGEPERILCPECGYREQVASFGSCRTCHMRKLMDAHKRAVLERERELTEEQAAELEAKRSLWEWRQKRHRIGASSPRERVAAGAL